MAPTSIMFYKDVGHSQEGTKEVTKLLDAGAFDEPNAGKIASSSLDSCKFERQIDCVRFFLWFCYNRSCCYGNERTKRTAHKVYYGTDSRNLR